MSCLLISIFVFVHPYMDGNARMGRFLMNTMLASGGYPWTVIPVESRDEYMQSLEKASIEHRTFYQLSGPSGQRGFPKVENKALLSIF